MTSIRIHAAAGHYAELGQMIVSFQTIEATVKHFLLLLIAHQQPSETSLTRVALSELSFAALLRVGESTLDIFNLEWLESMQGLADKMSNNDHAVSLEYIKSGLKLARSVEVRRNQLIHSDWNPLSGIPAPPGAILRTKARKRGKPNEIKIEVETIESISGVSNDAQKASELLALGFRGILKLQIATSAASRLGAA